MARVFTGEKHVMRSVAGWFERLIYKVTGTDPETEMTWKAYLFNLLVFNLAGIVVLFLLQLYQGILPFNPGHFQGVSWHLALNTAISFVTNTNWQSYSGENTMGNLVQLIGLCVQNFLSAATGMAVLIALIRGISRKKSKVIGNFWVDLTRSLVYILLPLSLLLSVVLVSQGVVQTLDGPVRAITPEGFSQEIPMGPVASQIAIKQLGTNGGGFFGANSAHPFENPTPLSNFLELLAMIIIPAGLVFTYGHMTGARRHARVIFITMFLMFLSVFVISLVSESGPNHVTGLPAAMEGKEVRTGITNSVLWSVTTTVTSNGSVNTMHDSLSPLSGMMALFNIMLGEIVFGGVGSGLYGMIVYVLLTVFIAGLLVGRTPEYLGKKVGAFEVKMAILAVLAPNVVIKLFSAIACSVPAGLVALNNAGPHGFTEILYAFSSAAGNNGSAFAGLNTNSVFYNVFLGAGMLIGRYGVIIPVLALAGNMATKKTTPESSGTFRTDNALFMLLLMSVILIVGGLTFFPALTLGPVAEHFLMNLGVSF